VVRSSHSHEAPDDPSDHSWIAVIAAGWVADDLSVTGLVRYAGVQSGQVIEALERAKAEGMIDEGHRLSEAHLEDLALVLDAEEVAAIHAAAARHLFASGPEGLSAAVAHTRAAGALMRTKDTVELAERAGRLSLSVGEYQAAYDLLSLAVDVDPEAEPLSQGARLCDLAHAAEALGRSEESRAFLRQALALGETAQSPALVARAAVMHALPVDWRAGDTETLAFLDLAQSMSQSLNAQVAIAAARALAEMRVPVAGNGDHQYAWLTRASVAQPIAEDALSRAAECSAEVRCTAMLAWRGTHRGPHHLERRLQISTDALNLAQRLRLPSLQVEAAIWLAVDALEAGQRRLFDEALSVARWVSFSDGSARMRWKALTLGTGAALIEEEYSQVEKLRSELRSLTDPGASPGFDMVEGFFWGQEMVRRDDPSLMSPMLLEDSHPALMHPIARAGVGYLFARTGDPATAVAYARWCLNRLDYESSYLLVATRIAAVALATGDHPLIRSSIEVLTPWRDRVAVDANGWWCDGPVSAWLAQLHHELGQVDLAREYLEQAEPLARSLNDLQGLRRIHALRGQISGGSRQRSILELQLSARELKVLELVAAGLNNTQIAATLGYSLSTIRTDTSQIYRKLQVKSRAEAVSRAAKAGIIST
jgi:DNA-binding CsgD family transcriptional regulator